jgi:hypothetical protein
MCVPNTSRLTTYAGGMPATCLILKCHCKPNPQAFVALCRGVGLDARLIVQLTPMPIRPPKAKPSGQDAGADAENAGEDGRQWVPRRKSAKYGVRLIGLRPTACLWLAACNNVVMANRRLPFALMYSPHILVKHAWLY